jgi:hypothetical protein
MSHRRTVIAIFAALALLAAAGASLAVASPHAVVAKKHHKHHKRRKHHKRHEHHKNHKQPTKPTKPTKPTYPAASDCSSGISAYGVEQGSSPNRYWDYTMGVVCQNGYWTQFQATTNEPITTGTLTAGIGTTGAPLACQVSSSTSFSCHTTQGRMIGSPSNHSIEVKWQSAVNPCTTSWSVALTIGTQHFTTRPWTTPGSCGLP